MALILSEGFDNFADASGDFSTRGWSNADAVNNTFDITGGKFGGGAAQILEDTGTGLLKTVVFGSTTSFRLAFWILMDATITVAGTDIVRFQETGVAANWELRVDASGFIAATEFDDAGVSNLVATTTDLRDGAWHHVEVNFVLGTLVTANGTIEIWVDGVKEVNRVADIINHRASGEDITNLDTVILNCPANSPANAVDYRIDDLVIWDDVGTAFTGRLDQHRIETLRPTAEGTTTGFTPSTGTDNSALIDEVLASTADYNSGSVAADKDTLVYGDLTQTPTVVHGVVVNTVALMDSGAGNFRAKARSVATEADGASIALTTTALLDQTLFHQDPNTAAAWATAAVNAAEFGYEVVTVTANSVRVAQQSIEVIHDDVIDIVTPTLDAGIHQINITVVA